MQGLSTSFLLVLASCIHTHALKSQRVTLAHNDDGGLVKGDEFVSGANDLARSIYPCRGINCAEKYVALKDSSYSWRVLPQGLSGTAKGGVTWEATLINMTSQHWMGKGETNHELWWHILAVITPSNLGALLGRNSERWATIFVGGGRYDLFLSRDDEQMRAAALMAALTGTTSVVVYQIPNQPVSFADDPNHAEKTEEAMKAWGWRKMFEQPERPEHAVELPIAKAIVRALDTVTVFTNQRLQNFAITGFSKRGVGSWMTAAIDKRVKAIMPGCHEMDLTALNHDIPRSYGHDPIAVQEYARLNISEFVDRPQMKALFEMVDPSTSTDYLKRLERVDKFFMAAGNDDFFMVDHAKYWLHLVRGPATYMMIPNRGHLSLMTQDDFLPAAAAFLQSTITKTPMPKINWEVSDSGAITVHQVSNHTPASVKVWYANTCAATGMRDFRTVTGYEVATCKQCGIPFPGRCKVTRTVWRSTELPVSAGSDNKTWVAWMPAPKDGGWRAFFVEFVYAQPSRPEPWIVTTEASVVPRTYPFPDCSGTSCHQGPMLVLAQMS